MPGVSWKAGACGAAIMASVLAGCDAVSQPRAINTGPFLVVPCFFFCNTELAIEAAEDNTGSVTGGAQNQSIDAGEAGLPSRK